MQALQQCIDQRSWPIKLGNATDPRWTKPLDGAPRTLGLPLEYKGEPIELQASFVTLSATQSFAYTFDRPPDFQAKGAEVFALHPQDVLKPADINQKLTQLGAADVRFSDGDRVLTLTFRSNRKEWQAGFYVMAALIKCFDGYGFELQDGQHGSSAYADLLLREAARMETGK